MNELKLKVDGHEVELTGLDWATILVLIKYVPEIFDLIQRILAEFQKDNPNPGPVVRK